MKRDLNRRVEDFVRPARPRHPTVSRWKNASWSEYKNKPGEVEFHDQVNVPSRRFPAEIARRNCSTRTDTESIRCDLNQSNEQQEQQVGEAASKS